LPLKFCAHRSRVEGYGGDGDGVVRAEAVDHCSRQDVQRRERLRDLDLQDAAAGASCSTLPDISATANGFLFDLYLDPTKVKVPPAAAFVEQRQRPAAAYGAADDCGTVEVGETAAIHDSVEGFAARGHQGAGWRR
jgi:hypothetical protein